MAPRRHFKLPDSAFRQKFRRRLLGWYAENGRDLPWRHTQDPYRILVSEVMLQQTQVDRVLPKYKEWLERFPSFEALATASVRQAIRTWYPLGYNVRPRRLHAIARTVVTKHGGKLPSDTDTLLAFKGLGKYTVGAVQSFAFGQRTAILDTNVARVLFRVFVQKDDLKSSATNKHLWALSERLLPRKHVFDFNQALMDLGAMVCVARKPRCDQCPMQKICRTFQALKD